MNETLYSRRSNLVIGFHGCDQSVVDKVVADATEYKLVQLYGFVAPQVGLCSD